MCKPILCLSLNCTGVDYSHFFQFPPPRFQKFQISCKSPFTNAPNAKNLCTTGPACQKQQKLPGLRQIANTACSHTWYLSLFYITAIWGQEILHFKKHKLATKPCVKFYTVCKAIFTVPIGKFFTLFYTTSGFDKYQLCMYYRLPWCAASHKLLSSHIFCQRSDFCNPASLQPRPI